MVCMATFLSLFNEVLIFRKSEFASDYFIFMVAVFLFLNCPVDFFRRKCDKPLLVWYQEAPIAVGTLFAETDFPDRFFCLLERDVLILARRQARLAWERPCTVSLKECCSSQTEWCNKMRHEKSVFSNAHTRIRKECTPSQVHQSIFVNYSDNDSVYF